MRNFKHSLMALALCGVLLVPAFASQAEDMMNFEKDAVLAVHELNPEVKVRLGQTRQEALIALDAFDGKATAVDGKDDKGPFTTVSVVKQLPSDKQPRQSEIYNVVFRNNIVVKVTNQYVFTSLEKVGENIKLDSETRDKYGFKSREMKVPDGFMDDIKMEQIRERVIMEMKKLHGQPTGRSTSHTKKNGVVTEMDSLRWEHIKTMDWSNLNGELNLEVKEETMTEKVSEGTQITHALTITQS